MEKVKYYFNLYKKELLFASSFISIILIACISFFIINNKYNNEEIISEENNITALLEEKNTNDKEEENSDKIKVDIKGCVNNPGVYELENGTRVIDAINKAGGLTENANTEGINLSTKLNDEDVIIINDKQEIKEEEKIVSTGKIIENKTTSNIQTKSVENKSNVTETTKNKAESSLNTIVNINTDSKEKLMTLNGIGESKAEKIIEYRNTVGKFKTKEELKEVKGIGDSTYEKIKDNITI